MIFIGGLLQVCDNSGVKFAKCLKIYGRKPKNYGKVGDTVLVTIKRIKRFSKIKRRDVFKGIIVRLKKKSKRVDGSFINFSKNSIVLLTNKGVPVGTRVFGPVSKDLRIKKNAKLITLCPKML
jgi:large subunit ribosomal protein L14